MDAQLAQKAKPAPVLLRLVLSVLRDNRVISIILQVVFAILVVAFFWRLIADVRIALDSRGLTPNTSFLNIRAGFDITARPEWYSANSTYGQAFVVGIINTLRVVSVGLVMTTILGVVMGILLLSSNWLVRTLSRVYVEVLRNTPLLVQLFVWYNIVMFSFPPFQESLTFPQEGVIVLGSQRIELQPWIYANIRGFAFPLLVTHDVWALFALVGIVAAFIFWNYAGRVNDNTGRRIPRTRLALLIFVGFCLAGALFINLTKPSEITLEDGTTLSVAEAREQNLLSPQQALVADGQPLKIILPQRNNFRFTAGSEISPEYMALLLGLVVYTSAFIAEIVRAGIRAVPHGQTEAARAVGLSGGQTLWLIVLPQALRVIIPPLGNQYLNLAKNSSLALAIAFDDVFKITTTIMNQSGQSVTGMFMVMVTYLIMSLTISLFVNLVNRRFRLVTR